MSMVEMDLFLLCFSVELCKEWIDLEVAVTGEEGQQFLKTFR